jgi:hypothetical protein
MKKGKKKKIKLILLISWIFLIFLGILLFRSQRVKILEDEQLDTIPQLQDREYYNFSAKVTLDTDYSPLYICDSDTIPEYLNYLAEQIDPSLQRVESANFVKWQSKDRDIIVYNIDSTVLNIYLDSYPDTISFTSVESFISEYITPDIEYFDINVDVNQDTEIYTANRKIGEEELVTGYGYSDFFYVEDGYLTSARILLADIEKSEYNVPLIKNSRAIERYLNDEKYPKDIILYTSEIIKLDLYTYEDFTLDFIYDECIINDIEPKLYFSSCDQNYIYYLYSIGGTCDLEYENELYSVPFAGFMNAVEPEYVKSE